MGNSQGLGTAASTRVVVRTAGAIVLVNRLERPMRILRRRQRVSEGAPEQKKTETNGPTWRTTAAQTSARLRSVLDSRLMSNCFSGSVYARLTRADDGNDVEAPSLWSKIETSLVRGGIGAHVRGGDGVTDVLSSSSSSAVSPSKSASDSSAAAIAAAAWLA